MSLEVTHILIVNSQARKHEMKHGMKFRGKKYSTAKKCVQKYEPRFDHQNFIETANIGHIGQIHV